MMIKSVKTLKTWKIPSPPLPRDLYAKFGSKMPWKWRKLAPFYLCAPATAPLFFTLAPPQPAPPFSVRASGAVA